MSGSLRLTPRANPNAAAIERLRAGQDLVSDAPETGLATIEEENAAADGRLEAMGEEFEAVVDRNDADEQLFRAAFADEGEAEVEAEAFGDEQPRAAAATTEVYAGPRMSPQMPTEGQELRVQNNAVGSHVAWRSIYSLPGYGDRGPRGDAIRHLGRTIFRTMATFGYMEEMCRRQGADPLGQIKVISHVQGRSSQADMRQVNETAAWITRNGDIMDAGALDFGQHSRSLAGYRPQIIAAMTDHDSFIMVRETYDTGAPVNATYIYSWKGGKLDLRNRPPGMVAAPAASRQIAAPQTVARPAAVRAAQPAAPQAARPQAARPAARPAAQAAPATQSSQGRGVTEPRPGAAASKTMFWKAKEAGFDVRPSSEGPCLQRTDGDTTVTLRCTGPLMMAKEFEAVRSVDGVDDDPRPVTPDDNLDELFEEPRPSFRA
ncbi:hypothetical protein [Gluconobacter potus]|uniref:hypothetical protein n=1 Tax=Gluconobacter potus TaxID=2724927 RepID=UPI000784FB04|nr:hypothetical protein [Gluconobacter potus]